MSTPLVCYTLVGVILFVISMRVITWLYFVYLKHEARMRIFRNEVGKEEIDVPVLCLYGLKLGHTSAEMCRISVWIYDNQLKMFDSLYNNALSKGGMSYETVLSLLHPDDREAYVNVLDELTSGLTEKTCELLRFYHNGKYELYRFNAVALKSETGQVDKLIGTEENMTDRAGEYTNFYAVSPCSDSHSKEHLFLAV